MEIQILKNMKFLPFSCNYCIAFLFSRMHHSYPSISWSLTPSGWKVSLWLTRKPIPLSALSSEICTYPSCTPLKREQLAAFAIIFNSPPFCSRVKKYSWKQTTKNLYIQDFFTHFFKWFFLLCNKREISMSTGHMKYNYKMHKTHAFPKSLVKEEKKFPLSNSEFLT